MSKRNEHGQFSQGSGNPGGKPKWVKEVVDAAGEHTKEAIERLAYWMRSNDGKYSLPASIYIIDRACGKPSQAIEHKGDATGFFDTLAAALNIAKAGVKPEDNGSSTEAGTSESGSGTVQ